MAPKHARYTPEESTSSPSGAQNGSTGRIVATVLVMILAVVAAIAFFTERWLFSTWATLSIDELFYHLRVSLEGTGSNMIVGYLVSAGVPILVSLAVVVALLLALRKSKVGYRVGLVVVALASVVALVAAIVDLDRNMGLATYVEDVVAPSSEDFIQQEYVDPATVGITFPEKKRNLVYIFGESLEMTFADTASGGAFEGNTIPELTKLAQQNEDFDGGSGVLDGAYSLPGTDWTMGGMFAQTSGLPLKLPLGGNSLEFAEEFFPEVVTLGDILKEQGYQQMLMIGSDASFGGRRLYFTQHGGYQMMDYLQAQSDGVVPKGYQASGWGFEDEKLFDWAKEELTKLAAAGKPFNFTMLTLDTHFPDGYVCRLCGDEFGDNQYANVYACSSRQISSFVEWLQQQDFYDDTTVVINGDHITMDADFCDGVSPDYPRRTYTCILNGQAQPADASRVREFSTLDMFPTTLAALGATIEGDKLGLGVNLYSKADTLVEQLGARQCANKLQRHSDFLDSFSHQTIEDLTMSRRRSLGGIRHGCGPDKG